MWTCKIRESRIMVLNDIRERKLLKHVLLSLNSIGCHTQEDTKNTIIVPSIKKIVYMNYFVK